MSRNTIDFGIDLGTTNSAISVMNAGEVETVKIDGREIVPSVVYVNKKGAFFVGTGAEARLMSLKHSSSCAFEFKRSMGSSKLFKLENGGEFTPAQLSAQVLKELRANAASRFNTDSPLAAVVTIPAMFETSQREATLEACKLAGFEYSLLLMEPVAAAIAAGFQTDSDKAYWIVFDFGGGTFDASIISIRDGSLDVIAHAGDNHLGGSDLDWAIVENLLVPKLSEENAFSHLCREAMFDTYEKLTPIGGMMMVLKGEAQRIKKKLSTDESADVEIEELVDANGDVQDLVCTITRNDVNQVIHEFVTKSVDITKKLIADSGLSASDIEKILMVGGTTLVPLVREEVAKIGIELDCSFDPMTIVSRGAAIYASSKKLPEGLGAASKATTGLVVDLKYQPIIKIKNPPIGGKITSAEGGSLPEGLQLRLTRLDEGWSSENIIVDDGGIFMTDVDLVEAQANVFKITAVDSSEQLIEISPSSFTIIHAEIVAGAKLPNSLRIYKADGTTDTLIEAGTQYPSDFGPKKVSTVRELEAGSSDQLTIPFVEGEQHLANRNKVGSKIIIKGTDVENTIPAGTEIEITGQIDDSGIPHYSCYVDSLEESFFPTSSSKTDIESSFLQEQNILLQERISEIEEKAKEAGNSSALKSLHDVTPGLDSSKKATEKATTTKDSALLGKARQTIIDMHTKLDEIESAVDWPSTLSKYNEQLDRAKEMIQEVAKEEHRNVLQMIEDTGDKAIQATDGKMLESVIRDIDNLMFEVVSLDPRFWAAQFFNLEEKRHLMTNSSLASSLFEQGKRALQVSDVDTLRSVVGDLYSLLPAAESGERPPGLSDVQ